jgi:ureidoacrylate peracid hydrolase
MLTTLQEKVDPRHTCLLVVDVQNDFCSAGGAADRKSGGILSSQAIILPVSNLIMKARLVGVPIINIKMTTYENGTTFSAVDLARRFEVWDGEMLVTRLGTWGHDNPSGVPLDEKDIVIHKHRNNAFIATELENTLRDKDTRTVIVTGLSTHACVLETALAAQGLDFYVVVPTDCVGSGNPELHEAGLRVLKATLHSEGLSASTRITESWSRH